ncbi:MAG: class I poly(R)-hydroxyalkanoic acid synthase [Pseudomonadota bacterium]
MSDDSRKQADPATFAEEFQAFVEQNRRIYKAFCERNEAGEMMLGYNPFTIAKSFWEWNARLSTDPAFLAEAQSAYWRDIAMLTEATTMRAFGKEASPVVEPAPGDRRFKDAAWNEELVFDHLKQSYLIYSRFVQSLVEKNVGVDGRTSKLVSFYSRRFIESASPTNFASTNPAVIRKTRETGGKNLVDGFKNMLRDLERGEGRLKITMTDPDAFELGRNLAYTEGAVIFENELMQLIEYKPTTETVFARPLVIVPPWINKYYALDLTAEKSLIKWLVDQGFSVFLISWVNPGRELARTGFGDYMIDGLLKAIDVSCEVTGAKDINVAGYCIGGTLTAATLAYLAATGDRRVHAATLIACMTDFEEAGELSVFIDDEQLETLLTVVDDRGYHMGEEMAGVFSLMRANDLIWSHVVSNYLLAEDSPPFDLVYWFQDSTRLPATMIAWYLTNLYKDNLLSKPEALVLEGVPLDLSTVKTPIYMISFEEDHICPWDSTYKGTQLFGGETDFVLGGSGHNAGVVNPPTKKKYGFRTGEVLPASSDDWLAGATRHEGSWWPHWQDWLSARSGEKVSPKKTPGSHLYKMLEPAPGRYVRQR